MTKTYIRTSSTLAIAIGGLAFASPVFAQEATSDQTEAGGTENILGEIVVTAQRREQRADDVGVTMSVLTWRRSRPMFRSKTFWPIALSTSVSAGSA
jgi:iron complex outermembrane receptor protein